MKNLLIFLGIVFVCLFSCSASPKKGQNFVKAAKSSKSVVLINIYKFNDSCRQMELNSLGSGIILTEDGYVISCNHVTEYADSCVIINNNDTILSVRIVGGSKLTDISILKIKNKLIPIKIGNSSDLKIGDNVLTIGYPLKLGISVSKGIVSNLIDNGSKYDLPPISYIQTDAVLNKGGSGGALINENGELVGITEMLVSSTGFYMGYSFAIPIDFIKPQIEYMIFMDKFYHRD